MSEHLYLLTMGLPLLTLLLIFGMRYGASVLRERARLANDEAYRQLAEAAAAGAGAAAAAMAATRAALDDVAARLGRIEKTLKDVE